MSQHDMNIANQGFPAFRADLNDALGALVSNSSGATAPSTTFAHQFWVDTAADPSVLKIRNADNDAWVTIGSINQTDDKFKLTPADGVSTDTISELTSAAGVTVDGVLLKDSGVVTGAGTVSAPVYSTTGDLNTGIFFPAADTIAFAEGGAEAMRIDSSGRFLLNTTSELTNIYFEASNITPTTQFITNQTGSYSGGLALLNYSAGGFGSVLTIGSSRSDTKGTNTTTSDGTPVAQLNFVGNDGTNFRTAAAIKVAIDGTSGSADMPGRLEFYTTADGAASATERMRITSDGYLRMASGSGGIQFGGDTAAANALDDYEEGTWTATFFDAATGGNQSSTTSTGYYTKIGDMVFFNFNYSNVSTTGLTGANDAYFTLPFATSATTDKNNCALTHVLFQGINWAGSQTQLTSFVGGNASRFRFYAQGDNVGYAPLKVQEIGNGTGRFFVSGQFRV